MINEERMRILQMIQEGKITAEEGAKLLEAMEETDKEPEQISLPREGKSLKVKITEINSGSVKVNLSLPLGIARFVKNFIPPAERMKLEDRGIDLDSVFANLDLGTLGKLIEVEDEQEGHKIEIWIE